jgi:hypothetical protein
VKASIGVGVAVGDGLGVGKAVGNGLSPHPFKVKEIITAREHRNIAVFITSSVKQAND